MTPRECEEEWIENEVHGDLYNVGTLAWHFQRAGRQIAIKVLHELTMA